MSETHLDRPKYKLFPPAESLSPFDDPEEKEHREASVQINRYEAKVLLEDYAPPRNSTGP